MRNHENSANDDQLDNTIYHWFIKKHTQGITVSGSIICEKTIGMYRKLGGETCFSK